MRLAIHTQDLCGKRRQRMAARAVLVPADTADLEFWYCFQRIIEQRLSEGNILAGERLWELAPSSGPEPRFTIRATGYQADCIECELDLESNVLSCTPG